jgi:hypothetical protein
MCEPMTRRKREVGDRLEWTATRRCCSFSCAVQVSDIVSSKVPTSTDAGLASALAAEHCDEVPRDIAITRERLANTSEGNLGMAPAKVETVQGSRPYLNSFDFSALSGKKSKG